MIIRLMRSHSYDLPSKFLEDLLDGGLVGRVMTRGCSKGQAEERETDDVDRQEISMSMSMYIDTDIQHNGLQKHSHRAHSPTDTKKNTLT